MKITGFSVRPFQGRWIWMLYIDEKVQFKGTKKKQFTALVAGCMRWAWQEWRKR